MGLKIRNAFWMIAITISRETADFYVNYLCLCLKICTDSPNTHFKYILFQSYFDPYNLCSKKKDNHSCNF